MKGKVTIMKSMEYMDYIMETMKKLIAIPSPSGFTREAAEFVISELKEMGYEPEMTLKRGVIVDLGGENKEDAVLLAAHVDTLGAMVKEIKPSGRQKLLNVGGMNPNNAETENCIIHTRDGRKYDGTLQLVNASTHVNREYNDTKRTWNTVEVVIDEEVKSAEDVENLGIMNGDYVTFDPRTVITSSGYIKSRFLDDKLCCALLMGYAKYLKEEKVTLDRQVYLYFTSYEEEGHGGASGIPANVKEMFSVDMGCVGEGLKCDETMVSICAKDSVGPYDYEITTELIRLARENNLGFAVDLYPAYTSDVDVALKAGHDIRHVVIGPGVYASHGYERSHKKGVANTFELIKAYLG